MGRARVRVPGLERRASWVVGAALLAAWAACGGEDDSIDREARRASEVREHLISSHGVSPEQVFVLDAKLESTGKAGFVPTKLALAPK